MNCTVSQFIYICVTALKYCIKFSHFQYKQIMIQLQIDTEIAFELITVFILSWRIPMHQTFIIISTAVKHQPWSWRTYCPTHISVLLL